MGSVAWANLRAGSLSIEENDLPSYFYLDAAVAYGSTWPRLCPRSWFRSPWLDREDP